MNHAPLSITILGAGLVGSLLGLYMHKAGRKVQLLEKRKDPRLSSIVQGRSINLALSDRGILALEQIGLSKVVLQQAIPMKGRMIHDITGKTNFQPYHHTGKCIYAISRGNLNHQLITAAEELGIEIQFGHDCTKVDFKNQELRLVHQHQTLTKKYDYVFGTDGAYSALRQAMQVHQGFDFSQQYLNYGYKELKISASANLKLELNALHIWPRHDFMMIALPNTDGSFTCTLFLPLVGENSFSSLQTQTDVVLFFEKYFRDILPDLEDLENTFLTTPTGNMVTIKTSPWAAQPHACLLGDAAHAIVPFYGQGMNAGFESVRLLSEAIANGNDFEQSISNFAQQRVIDTNAIAELAHHNFIEMRDLVADEDFIFRKKIESWLVQQLPHHFHTVYEQVTFSDKPYSHALKQSQLQQKMFEEMLKNETIRNNWDSELAKELASLIAKRYLKIQQ